MDPRFRKWLKFSTIVHAVIILGVIIAPLVANWMLRRERKNLVVIDLTLALPDIPADMAEAAAAVTPPAPEPPKDIPEETKPKPKVQKSTKRVTRTEPKPDQPKLTPEEIRQAARRRREDLRPDVHPDGRFPRGLVLRAREAGHVRRLEPAQRRRRCPAGVMTVVTIRVERDGTITARTLVQPSGNSLMDDSVMKAVQSVSRLRPLPPQWTGAYKDIDITFDLSAGGS